MSVFGTGRPPSSRTRPTTMIRSPIASLFVPAIRVRSFSPGSNLMSLKSGPVISDNVCLIGTSFFSGPRFTDEPYALKTYGGWDFQSRGLYSAIFITVLLITSTLVIHLLIHPLGDSECRIGRRRAGVNRHLKQHFFYFITRDAGISCGTDMRAELFVSAQGGQHSDGEHTADIFFQPRARPDCAPRALSHVALKVGVEVRLVGFSPLYIFSTQDQFAHSHTFIELIVRQFAPPERISSFARPLVQAVRCRTDARRFQSKKTPLPESNAPALGQARAA